MSTSRPTASQLLGLFLVSCSTLLLQVTWTRVLSVSLWYHFAFLVVSTALLGFGLSGVLLAVSRRLEAASLDRGLTLAGAGQATAIVVGFLLANRIPFAPFSLLVDPAQLLWAPLYVMCIAAPFVFAGLAVALLFARLAEHAGRIYFADLVGAGVGCLAIVLVMPLCGGSGSVLASAALAAAATLCFARSLSRAWQIGALVATLALLALAPFGGRLLPVRVSHTKTDGKAPIQAALEGKLNLHTAWNTFSRIDVLPAPFGRSILIDGGTALTRVPRVTRPPRELGPIADERNLVLVPNETRSALIIGSGGGWEVLAALRNRVPRVVAVEVNPLINDLVSGDGLLASFVGGIFSDPAVELHTDEARSFIRRQQERYDAIIASHTISNAATASGALSLAESYVMTLEAFADYLDHLTARGQLWISRPAAQLPRLVATAVVALRDRGIAAPARHVLVFSGGSFYGGMVVSIQPYTPERAHAARAQLRRSGLRILHLPGLPAPDGDGIYRRLLDASPDELEEIFRRSATRLRPATDDRPFFNQRSRWGAIDLATLGRVFRQERRGRMALEDQPVAEVTLLLVLVQSSLLALLLIVAPLLWSKRVRPRRAGGARLLLYFLALGLGFILCEIALIQRLTLFVGQPVYTFAAVVGVLLVASGAGSLISSRLCPSAARIPRFLRRLLVVVALLIVGFALLTPPVVRACLGLALPLRILLTGLLLLPLGLTMGMAFPLGIRFAGSRNPALLPWAWGLNAVASVVGSVAAMMLATVIGFSGVLLAAATIYLLGLLAWIRTEQ